MKHFLLAIVCLLSLNAKAQVYSFYNEKTYYGNIRIGEEVISLNDNDESFIFGYLPKVGNTYLSMMMFYFSSDDIDSFMKYEKKEVHGLRINLAGGNTIFVNWNNKEPLTIAFVDGFGMMVNMAFIDTYLNGEYLTITSKTKDKEKIKWIKQIKSSTLR